MKNFILKTLIIVVSFICVFEFTIGNKISKIYSKIDEINTKQWRTDGINKIRREIKIAVDKERYLSEDDAKLLNEFISKIARELSESK